MSRLLWCFLLLFAVRSAHADGGPAFDLDGPRIQAKVTRAGKTLPIGSVANSRPVTAYGFTPIFRKRKAHATCWSSRFSAGR